MDFRTRCFKQLSLYRTVAFIVLMLFQTACGLSIGEKPKKEPLKKETTLGCMNNLDRQFQGYLDHSLKESELELLPQCLASALLIFKYHVWGKDRQIYTPEELKNFIHEFFLQDQEISQNLMKELMIFKTSLIGGEADLLTAKEIDQIILLIEKFKTFLVTVYPHSQSLKQVKPLSVESAEYHLSVIQKASRDFLKALFQKPYSLESLNRLFRQMNSLLNSSSTASVQVTELLQTFRPFILSTPSETDRIWPDQWPLLAEALMSGVSSVFYMTSAREALLQNRVAYFSKSFEHLLSLFKKMMGPEGDAPLSQKDLMVISQALIHQKLLPSAVTPVRLQKGIKILFEKITPQQQGGQLSVGKEQYLWLKSQHDQWKKTQSAIDRSYVWLKDQDSFSLKHILRSPAVQADLFKDVKEKMLSLFTFRPLYKEGEGDQDFNVYFLSYADMEADQFNYKHLTVTAFYSKMTDLLFGGYAKTFPKKGLAKEELILLFQDFYDLFEGSENLENIDFSEGFIANMFLMAKLMTYITKGYYKDSWVFEGDKRIELISHKEAVEFLSLIQFIFKSANILSDQMEELCSSQITKSCFNQHILPVVSQTFFNMPYLVNEISSMSEKTKAKYSRTLFQLAVVDLENKENLQSFHKSQMMNLAIAFLYQEVMFTRFDVNSDHFLQKQEVLSAFPLYQGLIHHVAQDLFCMDSEFLEKDSLDKAIYLHSVHHRRPPVAAEASEKWMGEERLYFYLQARTHVFGWDLELTRPPLMQIALSLVENFLANQALGPCED